ncbi:MAG: hypothetical protein HUU30_17665 [Burkholderiaceae bacterium]|jgi:hypothetical protein|nr:hypothetical protein [Aquabacterium sp.]NUP87561.1 hypothetical protein [Burkholderiaceae bacterium]
MGPDSATTLASMVEDDDEDSASTLATLMELTKDVASLMMGHPQGRRWPSFSPDVLVVTVLPPSLVRATAEVKTLGHGMPH